MYNIPYFKETDQTVIVRFMKQHPFAVLIGCSAHTPVATQVPFLIEEKEGKLILQGHMMRTTNHHKAFTANSHALCLFTGPHTYVSASLYTTPQTASTWNYMTVHARGTIRFLGEDALLQILQKTTDGFEGSTDAPSSFQHLPKEYVDKLAKAIVGFQIEVEDLDAVFKLSQNKNEQSYHAITEALGKGDPDAQSIAAEMNARAIPLFTNKQQKEYE